MSRDRSKTDTPYPTISSFTAELLVYLSVTRNTTLIQFYFIRELRAPLVPPLVGLAVGLE